MALGRAWVVFLVFCGVAQGVCEVQDSGGRPAPVKGDALYSYLHRQAACPIRVQDLKSGLQSESYKVLPAMVANRGRHNPEQGSFSFFEAVTEGPVGQPPLAPGDFFFGHFTGAQSGELALAQDPDDGALLVEALAWDESRGLYNFYELIGTGGSAKWFYRGDSADALRDNRFLYRTATPGLPKFGNTMRCSACHTSGGPIMKELHPPFNDWWTKARPLDLGTNRPSPEVDAQLKATVDAQEFSKGVLSGMQKLEKSAGYQSAANARSLQEKLRPVFCETEINLASDLEPLDGTSPMVQIPAASLLAPLWGSPVLKMKKADYQTLLTQFGMHFPEIRRADADHAWLTAVKGTADVLAVDSLVASGLFAKEWVEAVYAIDSEVPVLSRKRCGLLKSIPESEPKDFMRDWQVALKANGSTEAQELLANLADPKSGSEARFKRARDTAFGLEKKLSTAAGRKELFKKLLGSRAAVFAAEISQNPRGTNPGTRFPGDLPSFVATEPLTGRGSAPPVKICVQTSF